MQPFEKGDTISPCWLCGFALQIAYQKKRTEIPGTGIFLHREFEGRLSQIACGLMAKPFDLFGGTGQFGRETCAVLGGADAVVQRRKNNTV